MGRIISQLEIFGALVLRAEESGRDTRLRLPQLEKVDGFGCCKRFKPAPFGFVQYFLETEACSYYSLYMCK